MSDKMIEIRGKKVSEDTIVEALKEHFGCGFDNRDWIVATAYTDEKSKTGPQIILNLDALTEYAKEQLVKSIQRKRKWISVSEKGCFGTDGAITNGLTFYGRSTEIVFPK